MTTSAQTSAHSFAQATSTAAPLSRPRPDLPSWFRGATTFLSAGCAGVAFALAGLALTALLTPAPVALLGAGSEILATCSFAVVLCVGAWCHTAAQSRRVDPTTPHLRSVWFLIAWFIPVVNLFLPHRMLGDLWASAKWQQSNRRGSNTPLAPRPWVIAMWAWVWGLLFAVVLLGLFRDDATATWFAGQLGLLAASTGLLGGVVRVIARELDGPAVSPAVS